MTLFLDWASTPLTFILTFLSIASQISGCLVDLNTLSEYVKSVVLAGEHWARWKQYILIVNYMLLKFMFFKYSFSTLNTVDGYMKIWFSAIDF
jgi:hypothetical protein